jgi:hypothetical protein
MAIQNSSREGHVSSHDERRDGPDLIALAQKLARDAEHHALLSASLASQAERLMIAGLRKLEGRTAAALNRPT